MESIYYEQLFNLFGKLGALTPSLCEDIINYSSIVNIKKKKKLLSEGEKSENIFFILKGSLRIYYLDKKGEETNTWFLSENELAISVYSFFTSQPSFECIETLEDCTLITLSKNKLDELYNKHLEFNIIGRRFTELYYVRNEAQTNSLRMLTAKERYLALCSGQPHIIQRIPLGHIASYLGISPETLSRIRKQ